MWTTQKFNVQLEQEEDATTAARNACEGSKKHMNTIILKLSLNEEGKGGKG